MTQGCTQLKAAHDAGLHVTQGCTQHMTSRTRHRAAHNSGLPVYNTGLHATQGCTKHRTGQYIPHMASCTQSRVTSGRLQLGQTEEHQGASRCIKVPS
eukprot:1159792-Pelagomonas_calceolata.AAC.21